MVNRAQAARRTLEFKHSTAARPDLKSTAALRQQKRLGLPAVNKAMRRVADRDAAIDFLAMRLPEYALAKAVGYNVDVLHSDRDKVMQLLRVKGSALDWDPKAIRTAGNAIDALFRDLESQGIVHHGRPQAGDISWHLHEFRKRRQEEAARRKAFLKGQMSAMRKGPRTHALKKTAGSVPTKKLGVKSLACRCSFATARSRTKSDGGHAAKHAVAARRIDAKRANAFGDFVHCERQLRILLLE